MAARRTRATAGMTEPPGPTPPATRPSVGRPPATHPPAPTVAPAVEPVQPTTSAPPSASPLVHQVATTGSASQRKLHTYNGDQSEDPVQWLQQLDLIVNPGSNEHRWASHLAAGFAADRLGGIAAQWYLQLNREVQTNYELLVQQFTARFINNPAYVHAAQTALFSTTQRGASITAYGTTVATLCNRVDANMPEFTKIQHFARGLQSQQTQIFIKTAMPPTLIDAITRAAEFEAGQALIRTQSEPAWTPPNRWNTWTNARPTLNAAPTRPPPQYDAPQQPQNPQRTGSAPTQANNARPPANARINCYNCNGVGHMARNCPSPPNNLKGS